ncbi:MAG TPA: succinylglutamate desuccinylase/aspartoacylase family protein [Bacteroidia bacterium]|jgi:predicted deacylase|nr:succinylglutamate desuccinylase/aspartoacylase family protein [Bacteroidia bacterium]
MPKPIVINRQIIQPGENKEVNMNMYRLPTRTIMEIPVHVFRSVHEGPVVLLSAGMHGDEINGIEIIRQLLRSGHLSNLKKGSILAMPIINIISFLNHSRDLPDGKDLNRCFPGTQSGSLGSRIAYDMMNEIVPLIDLGVDFHTGGARINNYPQIRCVFRDNRNLELAKMFGSPFILNADYREKSFRHEASRKGKPVLVYEAGESMRFNEKAITEGVNGCLRLMKNLGMIDLELEPAPSRILNDTTWVRADISGMFRTTKKYGSFIKKNEVIGSISDPYGEIETTLKAPETGYIIGINNKPVINEGDALIHVGME